MGCDIHAAVYAQKPDVSWGPEIVAVFREPRWYDLFGALAGVRNDEVPHIPPRGLPDYAKSEQDCPTCYGDNAFDFGDHSFSWLTTDEFRAALHALSVYTNSAPQGVYGGVYALMKAMETDGYQCTLVFGFDS